MSRSPVSIPHCNHLKVNGTQCGSTDLRGRRFCYFHNNWHGRRIQLNRIPDENDITFNLLVLGDANSIQVALMRVMRLILSHTLDLSHTFEAKSDRLLLCALQTASLNLWHADLEPMTRERVVIDPGTVHESPLDAYPWEVADFEDELDQQDVDRSASSEETSQDDDEEDDEEEDEDEDEDAEEEDEDEGDDEDEEDEPPLYVEDGRTHAATVACDNLRRVTKH